MKHVKAIAVQVGQTRRRSDKEMSEMSDQE